MWTQQTKAKQQLGIRDNEHFIECILFSTAGKSKSVFAAGDFWVSFVGAEDYAKYRVDTFLWKLSRRIQMFWLHACTSGFLVVLNNCFILFQIQLQNWIMHSIWIVYFCVSSSQNWRKPKFDLNAAKIWGAHPKWLKSAMNLTIFSQFLVGSWLMLLRKTTPFFSGACKAVGNLRARARSPTHRPVGRICFDKTRESSLHLLKTRERFLHPNPDPNLSCGLGTTVPTRL